MLARRRPLRCRPTEGPDVCERRELPARHAAVDGPRDPAHAGRRDGEDRRVFLRRGAKQARPEDLCRRTTLLCCWRPAICCPSYRVPTCLHACLPALQVMWELWTSQEPYAGMNYHALMMRLASPKEQLRPPLPGSPEWEGELPPSSHELAAWPRLPPCCVHCMTAKLIGCSCVECRRGSPRARAWLVHSHGALLGRQPRRPTHIPR